MTIGGFNHPYGEYNVESTVNEWFRINLTANGTPYWMPSARVLYNYPETNIISGYSGHAFTVAHLGAVGLEGYQGRTVSGNQKSVPMEGILQVDCWMSKSAASNYHNQWLMQCSDMVGLLFASARETRITDVYASTGGPNELTALVRFHSPERVEVPNPDPENPDLIRRSHLLRYQWEQRFSG
jgi:hypothetical protein